MATKTRYLRPLALVAAPNWSIAGVASVDPLDPISHDDNTSYGFYDGVAFGTGDIIWVSLRDKPNDIRKVTSLTLFARDRGEDVQATINGKVQLLGSIGTHGSWLSTLSFSTFVDRTATLNNPVSGSGGVWTAEDIAQPSLYVGVVVTAWSGSPSPGLKYYLTSLYARLIYEPVPPQIGSARDAPSRRVFDLGSSRPEMRREILDLKEGMRFDLLQPLLVSHYDAPDAENEGWPEGITTARQMVGTQQDIDMMALKVGWHLRDMRRVLALYRDTGWALRSAAPWAEGVARHSHRGAVDRVFTRDSRAWVPDPADGLLEQIEIDQEKLEQGGQRFERTRQNLILESGFKNGSGSTFTQWTQVGTGGGNTITEGTSGHYFKPDVVGRHPILTFATAAASDLDLRVTTDTASQAAGTVVSVRVAYRDADAAEPCGWWLQRLVDNWYWNESTRLWQSAKVVNQFTGSIAWAREGGDGISVGNNATALRTGVGIQTAWGVDGQVNHISHVQLEVGEYATSVILSEGVLYTRAPDKLLISNNNGARNFSIDQGSASGQLIPSWWRTGLTAGASFAAVYEFESDGSDLLGVSDLTPVNSPTYAVSVRRNGAQLTTAGNEYFHRAAASATDFDPGTESAVIAIKVRRDATTSGMRLAYKGRITGDLSGWMLASQGTGDLRFSVRDSSTLVSLDAALPADSAWHSVVAVINRSNNTISLYVDRVTSTPVSIASIPSIENVDQDVIYGTPIGGQGWEGGVDQAVFLRGRIWDDDDVAEYHAAAISSDTIDWQHGIMNIQHTLVSVQYDSNDLVYIYYDQLYGQWVHRRDRGGVSATNVLPMAIVSEQTYNWVARWTGQRGELGLPVYSQSLFAGLDDGTELSKASDTSAPGQPEEVPECDIEFGAFDTGGGAVSHVDGRMRLMTNTSHVPTDTECQRFPPR